MENCQEARPTVLKQSALTILQFYFGFRREDGEPTLKSNCVKSLLNASDYKRSTNTRGNGRVKKSTSPDCCFNLHLDSLQSDEPRAKIHRVYEVQH